jgi:spermidine/putrescine-binding protein
MEKTMHRVTMLIAAGLVVLLATSLPTIKASAQQAVVTDANLDQMITSAKTPADHDAIAAFYEQQAAEAKNKAEIHRKTAETYRRLKLPKPVDMAEMCDGIAAMWDKIAADYSKLADSHHEMAKKAGAGA